MRKTAGRLHALDALRGATVISMVIYHAMWDLVYLYGVHAPWYLGRGAYIWQQSICWIFILLSGFSWQLGRKHLRRGLIVFASGWLVTLATVLFEPSARVLFGVLTMTGSSMLLMIPLDAALAHGMREGMPEVSGEASGGSESVRGGQIPGDQIRGPRPALPLPGAVICAAVSFAIFALTRNVNAGTFGFEGWSFGTVPRFLYASYLTTYLGFPMPGFWSSDYFSLIPWFFLFLTGYFVHDIWRARPVRVFRTEPPLPIRLLEFIGRRALPVYLLHQVILSGLFMLLFRS